MLTLLFLVIYILSFVADIILSAILVLTNYKGRTIFDNSTGLILSLTPIVNTIYVLLLLRLLSKLSIRHIKDAPKFFKSLFWQITKLPKTFKEIILILLDAVKKDNIA